MKQLTSTLSRGVRLLCEDANGLFALEKSEGILSHPNVGSTQSGLFSNSKFDFRQECYICDGRKYFLLNRLDSATSGVLLLSASEQVSIILKNLFRLRDGIEKSYFALSFMEAVVADNRKKLLWQDPLVITKQNSTVRASAGEGRRTNDVRLAETEVEVNRFNKSKSLVLLALNPLTGYSHQLRFQCAKHRLPIVGDKTYGNFRLNKETVGQRGQNCHRLFLHSSSVRVHYSIGSREFEFFAESPLPEEFLGLIST